MKYETKKLLGYEETIEDLTKSVTKSYKLDKKKLYENAYSDERMFDLFTALEKTNLFSDCFQVFNNREKYIITQDEYLELINEHYKKILGKDYLLSLYAEEDAYMVFFLEYFKRNVEFYDVIDFYDDSPDLFINTVETFFLHRYLDRNLKSFYMQELVSIALLETIGEVDNVESFRILESEFIDFYFAIDLVVEIKHKNGLTLYYYIHVTKKGTYTLDSVVTKVNKDNIYFKDVNGENVKVDRFLKSANIILEYRDYYKDSIEISEKWFVPRNPKDLVEDFVNSLSNVSFLLNADYEKKGNVEFFEIERLSKLKGDNIKSLTI